MSETPKLSICVPSRNRQIYFQQTIRDLLRNPREDIEFVFADNSDDPAVMDAFMGGITDGRARYLASLPEALPMQDNWERTVSAVRGEWVVVIGDDDFVDTGLPDILVEIERRAPETEMVGWSRLTYNWPGYRAIIGNMSVQMGNRVVRFPRELISRRMFRWEGAGRLPANPFTIYHGAVRRPLLEKIRTTYGNRHFEHPVVDYEYACKIIQSARHIVYVERPLSVLGACPKSNSAVINNFEKSLENYDTFLTETGGGAEASEWMKGFPFKAHLGVAGAIMGTQHWFKTKYAYPVEGWEMNFAASLAHDCANSETRRGFELQSELCRRALSDWKGGVYLKHFNPHYIERINAPIFTGMIGDTLYIDERVGSTETPAAALGIVRAIIDEPSSLNFTLDVALSNSMKTSTAA